mmetsp:Transcript_27791/g.64085  ORF Transcript_27791/g.64085 Transcript_27791/m.64085 type:complete len:252 (+) Transcript_27791:5453-6208(+)
MQQCSKRTHHSLFVSLGHADQLHRIFGVPKIFGVVDAIDGDTSGLVYKLKLFGIRITQKQSRFLLCICASQKLIENVIVALALSSRHETTLLQKVGTDIDTSKHCLATELHFNEFTEATGVIIGQGLGVTEGLEQRIGLDNLLFQIAHTSTPSNFSNIPHCDFCALRFSSTTLTAHDDGLGFPRFHNCGERSISNAVDVRRQLFCSALFLDGTVVTLHVLRAVDGQCLERIHGDQNLSTERVAKVVAVTVS